MTGQTEQRRLVRPPALRVLRTIGKIILVFVGLLVALGVAELLLNRLRGYQVVMLKDALLESNLKAFANGSLQVAV